MLATPAPAKINLTLHVLGRRADGRHELESLVAFSGAGDALTLAPGPRLALELSGPTAAAAGAGADNLVLLAAEALAARIPGLALGGFRLVKRLPVAAGIGGGSSDAAAALRLLARLNALAPDDPRLIAAAAAAGSDVPVCLVPRARMMRGAGETLGPALVLPPLPAVLVNPGVAVETRAVFARLGLAIGQTTARGAHPQFDAPLEAEALFAALKHCGNDLEPAARALSPAIDEVLALLEAAPGRRLARMSGSGATCFALFSTCRQAVAASAALKTRRPGWWIKTALLR